MNLLAADQLQQWGNTLWVSTQKKTKLVKILTTKKKLERKSWIEVYQPGSMCRNGWWRQRWEWCCVCPAAGPAWGWMGNPGWCLLCISLLDPSDRAHRCVSGCLTARWRRRFHNERLTPWRKPADVYCHCANQSYPAVRIYNSTDAPKVCSF